MAGGWVGALLFAALMAGVALTLRAGFTARYPPRTRRYVPPPPASPAADEPHGVYFINYAVGGLCYIGFSNDPKARLKRHRYTQSKLPAGHPRNWWPLIDPNVQATFTPNRVDWYPNEQAARAAEAAAIRRLNPPGNQVKYKTERIINR